MSLCALEDGEDRVNLLCELNGIKQVANTADTTIVQVAWGRGQELALHGSIHDTKDGLLKNLDVTVNSSQD